MTELPRTLLWAGHVGEASELMPPILLGGGCLRERSETFLLIGGGKEGITIVSR